MWGWRHQFRDRVVAITGASSGIGEALAEAIGREGAAVVLLARRQDRLVTLQKRLESQGIRCLVSVADVTHIGSLQQAFKDTVLKFGRLDIVVANAGFAVMGPTETLTPEDYQRQFDTNIFGVLNTLSASRSFLQSARGQFVIVGSVNSYVGLEGVSPYVMSKFAVRGLAECLHFELRSVGISTTFIAPGFVESEIRQVDNQGQWHDKAKDSVPKWLQMPAPRAAQSIAKAIALRQKEKVITFHGWLLVWAMRHFPALCRWMILMTGIKGRSPTKKSLHQNAPA